MDCHQKSEREQRHSNWNKYDNKLWDRHRCVKKAMKRQQTLAVMKNAMKNIELVTASSISALLSTRAFLIP